MKRWFPSRVLRVITVTVVVVMVAASATLWRHLASSADASGTNTKPTTGFYLAIGASSSLGFQPTGIPAHNGRKTSTGYANDLDSYEAKRGIHLQLRQVGCPGETAVTMLTTTDHCYIPPGRQLWAAEKYLKKEGSTPGLVTIDLGFNDVRACMLGGRIDQSCAVAGITNVREDLPKILVDLKDAAGPNVHFIGLDYSDPFLWYYLRGGSEFDVATNTLTIINDLNETLDAAYSAAHIPTANVAGGYKLANTAPTALANVGTVPQNVASECTYTWMCANPPWGPDDHPNNVGYAVIATEIEAKLPPGW
ncbi:MAG TPA: hypothetical protein VMU68_11825 [Acidimicrobiales bacterium]|nr:hypothetical protein [Acidimicrobiales bacterium]